MNNSLIKKLDDIVGVMLTTKISPPVIKEISFPITSLLIIRPGGIGDAALLGIAIRSLKMSYPAIHITVLAEQRNAGVFTLISDVDKVLCYDRPGELFMTLRYRYSVVIDTEQNHHLSAVVARIVSAPVKIGFDTNERRRMFTHLCPYLQDDYEAESFVHLLKPLGIKFEAVKMGTPFLSLLESSFNKVNLLLESLHNMPFVTVFPGASIPERQWGARRFRAVAELLSSYGIKIVIIGGKEDRQQGDEIVDGGAGLNIAGLTSLSETAAVIKKSSLLLSGDSGVLHLAVGLGVPTISLFGPGRSMKWAPSGDIHFVINRELPCSPCTTYGITPPCPINVKCMSDITVNEVVNAITMMLSRIGALQLTRRK